MNKTEQLLKKEMSLSRKSIIGIAIGMAMFYLLSTVFCFCVHSAVKTVVSDQAVRSITNISQLNKDSVYRSIANRRVLLKTLSRRLERQNVDDVQTILEEMSDFGSSYEFYKIGCIDQDKTVYLTDGTVLDASDLQLAEDVWDDHFHLTESYLPYTGGEHMVNTFTYPVRRDGEIRYVLIATYYSSKLTERMNISSMEGKGYSFLLNTQGEAVIYPLFYKDQDYSALMKYINDASEIIPNTSGDSYFTYNGKRYFAHFEELGINDWFLMTCIKESDLLADGRDITLVVYISSVILWLAILCGIGYIFYYMRKTRLRRTRETFYDDLLNIPNKKALNVVYKGLPEPLLDEMYLIIFDIDKFKEFNYIYGSESGDDLLKYIVKVLYGVEPNAYLFRYMSDYFVTLDTSSGYDEYEEKMNAVLDKFRQDIEDGVIPPFDISAGVRKVRAGEPLQLVISDALVAREMVKGNHLRSYAFYDEAIRNQRLLFMEIESDFPTALRKKEFKVYYQPKVDMRTGEIIGAEALARWIRPDGRIIMPSDFVPCLEESRQIIQLDEEMLSEVCRQMKEMEDDGLEVKRVSVNLSRVHLRNLGILSRIEETIRHFKVDPMNLSFEITETVLYEDSIPLKTILDRLHALGCRVEMDDYGVGVSGPNSLAQNNFDAVKLDKSLVDGLGNERVEDVIFSTAHMAGKWGMQVLVEGVEERSQAERLVELGCPYAQGYYYSRPVPEEEYRELLRSRMIHGVTEHLSENGAFADTGFAPQRWGAAQGAAVNRFRQKESVQANEDWNAGINALMDEGTIYVGVNLSQNVVESENRFGSWTQKDTGLPFGEFIKSIVDEWLIPESVPEFESFFDRERILELYAAGQREDTLEYLAMNEGRPQWFRVTIQIAEDASSNDIKVSLVFRNVDQEVQERTRLKDAAERDSMTGIYNRATTERLIREALEQHEGERCCFLIIDLDDLRTINSSLGHPEGDKALKSIADMMCARFRKDDILGRIGGDEFVAFLKDVPEADGLQATIADFMRRIRETGIGPQEERPIHVSIGGAVGIAGREDFKTLYEQADLALYYTKANGKNAFHFYTPELENREFTYQPRSMAKQEWDDSIEIRRLVKAMSAFFPLVFSVNLTRNTYRMLEYAPYIEERADDEGSFDELVEIGVRAFHPEDREAFLTCCRRESLLQAYADGKRIVSHKGRQLGADGIYRMVQTVVMFIDEEDTGDICQITFASVCE